MPDIFISYNRDDSLAMGIIRDNLRKLGFNLWIDIEHLEPGTPQWMRAIKEAIRDTDAMIVLCSPAAERSKWVNIEITIAEELKKKILPVWINGDSVIDSIPTSLLNAQHVDMRGRINPEQGFRKLVYSLIKHFGLDTPDYEFVTGAGQIPTIQVINVHGHVEGHIVAIGQDVKGDVNIAGGSITYSERPEDPPPLPEPITEEKVSTAGIMLNTPPSPAIQPVSAQEGAGRAQQAAPLPSWVWIGGLGVVAVIVVIGLIALWGNIGPDSQATEKPTRNRALMLAETGVSSNVEWEPYIQEFNGVKMALVPVGCFMMGSEDGESDERPVHEACFDEPFWIDVYEVTNGQYGSSGNRLGNDLPRETINWFDSVAHCESRGARLPTEAEWEYAARGPDGLVYPWGNDFDCSRGNFDDETQYDSYVVDGGEGCDGFIETAPVGSFASGMSWVGAYDLSGNIWEWVNDWYDSDYYTSSPGVNPQGSASGEYRVLRGGSWFNDTYNARAARRYWFNPSYVHYFIGFRCALSY